MLYQPYPMWTLALIQVQTLQRCACSPNPDWHLLLSRCSLAVRGSAAKWLQSIALTLADKSDGTQVESMIGCRSHSWVAPQGCLGVP